MSLIHRHYVYLRIPRTLISMAFELLNRQLHCIPPCNKIFLLLLFSIPKG